MRRVHSLAFGGAAAILVTALVTSLLADFHAPLWLTFSFACSGVFSSGYLTGRRDEVRSTLKEKR